MRLVVFYIIYIISNQIISAQKIIEKELYASDISTIIVSGNTMFNISMNTKPINKVNLVLAIEGENNEQIVLKTIRKQDTIFISSEYQPLFNVPDDKLSAHKKISIELNMIVPENIDVSVKSDIGSVQIKGIYKSVFSELVNGNFKAFNVSSNLLVINTLHGNIYVETNTAIVDISTKNGEVHKEQLDFGKQRISLNSINGDIRVIKTQ